MSSTASRRLFAERSIFLPAVNSTMEEARSQAMAGAPHGTTVVAQEQHGGRGRHGRYWASPKDAGLYQTTVLVVLAQDNLTGLTLVMGAAVLRALHALGATEARIKWPNDIVVGGRKLAGVLTERLDVQGSPRVLVGVGVNLAAEPPAKLQRMDPDAAEAYVGLLSLVDTATVLATHGAVSDAMEEAYNAWQLGGMHSALAFFERFHALQGEVVTAQNASGHTVVGAVAGVAADGGLKIMCGTTCLVVYAGEVTRVRALER